MALFKRKQKDSVLPEVDQYYEGERHDRAGLAWLLALVSVVIVALVIVGLFLGGRWVYRQIADDDGSNEVAITDNENGEIPSFDGGTEEDDESENDSSEPAGDSEEDNTQEDSEPEESESDEEEGNVDAPARTDVPSTGDSEGQLPGTGPANLVGVFTGVSAVAGGIHYVVTRKRSIKR